MLFYVPVEGVHKIGPLDIFFEARSRFESRNDVLFDSSLDQDRTIWQNRGRLGFDYRTSDDTNIRVTYQYSNIQTDDDGTASLVPPFWTPTSDPIGRTRQDLTEAYLEHKAGDDRIRFGRQMVGRDWLVGTNDWGEVARAWNGVSGTYGAWDFFAGRLDLDNVSANSGKEYLYFTGYNWGYGGKTTVYYKRDQVLDDSIYTAGHTFMREYNNVSVGVNGAFQWGRNDGVDLEAWAAQVHVGIDFDERLEGFAAFQTASGGGSSTLSRTFDDLYPSDHGRLGNMDLQALSNVTAFSVGLGYEFNEDVAVSAIFHDFSLFDEEDAWYNASNGFQYGFVDPSGASGDDIGSEFDLSLRWRLPNNLRLNAGFSTFDPGDFISSVSGNSSTQNWYYASLSWRY